MNWEEIATNERFLNASPELQQNVKQDFFNNYVRKGAEEKGLDVAEVESRFMSRATFAPKVQTADTVDGGLEEVSAHDQFLADMIDPDTLLDWKSKGKIGAVEAFSRMNKWEMLPYLNSVAAVDSVKILDKLNRANAGEDLTDQEKDDVREYVLDMMELETRGYDNWGKMAVGLSQMPAFAVEFMTSGGLVSAGKKALFKGSKQAVKTATKNLAQRAAIGSANLAATGAARTVFMPHRAVKGYADQRINDGLVITDKGQVLLQENAEKPATTMMRAIGDLVIENVSEQTGQVLLAPLFGNIRRGVASTLPKKLVDGLDKLSKATTNTGFAKAIEKTGYDGFLEELGEERIGDLLRATFDLDQDAGYSTDDFLNAVFPDPNQVLVEAGVIGLWGGMSRTSQYAMNKLIKSGKSVEEARQIVDSLSENEKENLLKSFKKPEDAQSEQAYLETRSALRQQIVDAGLEDADADAVAALIDARVMAVADSLGERKVDVINRWGLQIQREEIASFTPERDTPFQSAVEADQLQTQEQVEIDAIAPDVVQDDAEFKQDTRGAIKLGKDKTIISLFEGADKSTILHELGHLFLRDVEYYANTTENEAIKSDMESVRAWLGNDGGAFTMDQQEQFARGFEQYLREGKAPTKQLQSAFDKFKEWLRSIYASAKALKVNVPADISSVFDSMFMTEAQKIETGFYEPLDAFEVLFQSGRFVYQADEDIKRSLDKIEYILDGFNEVDASDIRAIRKEIRNIRELEEDAKNKQKITRELDAVSELLKDKEQVIKAQLKRKQKALEREKRSLEALEPVTEEQYQAMLDLDVTEQDLLDKKGITIKNGDNLMRKIFTPISTRLGDIDKQLKHTMRRFEFNVNIRKNADMEKVVGFFDKVRTLSENDFKRLDFAMKNIDLTEIDRLAKKYGMVKDIKAVRSLLDDLRQRAIAVGIDVNLIENYFPRSVNNSDAYLSWLKGTENWTYIERQLKEAEMEDSTNDEKAEFINLMLARYDLKEFKERIFKSTRPTAQRKFTRISPEMNVFYKDSFQAILNYIGSMNNLIEAKKFWGLDKLSDKSIGQIIDTMITEKKLTVDQEAELKNILRARFGQIGTRGFIRAYKNFSYIYTMGSISSAITQIGDIGLSLYKNGFYNTKTGLLKAISSSDKITKEDLGITQIAQEFADETKTENAVRKVFKLAGVEFMDNLGKETTINAALARLQDSAKRPSARFKNYLQDVFGKESEQVISDLKNGVASENVRYLLFSELSDLQPISLSEMPEQYLTGGNARIFYMLKTYTIKLFDIYRNDVFKKINSGNDDEIKEGLQNLIRLTASLAITGMTADAIKDVLFGRDIDISDLVLDNILKLFGFSKWQIYKSRKDGLFTTLLQSILPPIPLLDDVYKDITAAALNKKCRDIEDFRTWKGVPIVGKLYYWWFGGGKDDK